MGACCCFNFPQLVHVKSSTGWQFELSLRPSSDLALHDKYSIADFIQVWTAAD